MVVQITHRFGDSGPWQYSFGLLRHLGHDPVVLRPAPHIGVGKVELGAEPGARQDRIPLGPDAVGHALGARRIAVEHPAAQLPDGGDGRRGRPVQLGPKALRYLRRIAELREPAAAFTRSTPILQLRSERDHLARGREQPACHALAQRGRIAGQRLRH